MELAQLLARDPNTLPYFITEARTGRVVPVRFEPLTAEDEAELRGAEWAGARFAPVWQELALAEDKQTFKLTAHRSRDRRIQGLVRVGTVEVPHSNLVNSLLESAPFNQHTAGQHRAYRGVGKQLVLRLVVESYRHGGLGRVQVRAARGTSNFYRALGFEPLRESSRQYLLDATTASQLLSDLLVSEQKESHWLAQLWRRLWQLLRGERS